MDIDMMKRRQLLQAAVATLLARVAPPIVKPLVFLDNSAPTLFDGEISTIHIHSFALPLDWTGPTWEESWANANKMFGGADR